MLKLRLKPSRPQLRVRQLRLPVQAVGAGMKILQACRMFLGLQASIFE
jgi:hypothetical protein